MKNDTATITVLVENHAEPPFEAEHGLALKIEYRNRTFLFDTGAGGTLLQNLAVLGIPPESFREIILSHGHSDHTGALHQLVSGNLRHVPGVEKTRFSRHPGVPVRNIAMPPEAVSALPRFHRHEVTEFTGIGDGVFLTGAIPRTTSEDCGGPFFLDAAGSTPDPIADEQAMLLDCGVLIQGCCHAGIVNTLQFCRRHHPEIAVHTVVGGLHLLHAENARLQMTAEALRQSEVRQLFLMHCTGENAVAFLKKELPSCRIHTPVTGECFSC